MSAALVLLAHGARNPEWAKPFQRLALELQAQRPALHVRLAFLEFLDPTLPMACDALVPLGCTDIDVIPCFFGGAGHVMRDVPPLINTLRERHPTLRFRLHDALGEQPALQQALLAVCLSLLDGAKP